MQVQIGQDITSQLIDPAGDYARMGARVEEPITEAIISPWQDAALSGGVWTVVCDAILDPPGPGDYLLYWMTPEDPPLFRTPLPLTVIPQSVLPPAGEVPDFPPIDVAEVTPTVQEVADLEGTRWYDTGDNDVGGFGSDTRPTDVEVGRLIDQGLAAVLGSLRPSFPTKYYPKVRHLVCLYTAQIIEGSFYREQVPAAGSVFHTLYTTALTEVQAQIEYDLKQWRLMQRIEPPFTERREPWQRVGWNPGAIP